MNKLYSVARLAYRKDERGDLVPALDNVFVTAKSADEARRTQLEIARKMYPLADGWEGHVVEATPITRESVNKLIGYITL